MQLMPDTAKRYGVGNRRDPHANVLGGTRYLKDLLDMFDNDLVLALAAYNAGENTIIKYGHQIPPYEETRSYVRRVLKYYNDYKKFMSASFVGNAAFRCRLDTFDVFKQCTLSCL